MWRWDSRCWDDVDTFLLTHPVWDVTRRYAHAILHIIFLLTHPVWDVTHRHRPNNPVNAGFLLTHPVWDVTRLHPSSALHKSLFLLTHPVWDVTIINSLFWCFQGISTHTSRVGCDRKYARAGILPHFYSHIPCGMWLFAPFALLTIRSISTHTSRVGCDWLISNADGMTDDISTHTSRVGCDRFPPPFCLSRCWISTHTSRVGCDYLQSLLSVCQVHFYSHIPCGMWRFAKHCTMQMENFYSHIPCGMWRKT